MRFLFFVLCFVALTSSAAEFKGRNLDGESFSATAFSYDTGKFYTVDIEFDGTEAVLTFDNGNTLTLELNEEEIDDPSSVSAFDYDSANYWDLDVEGLDRHVASYRRAGSTRPTARTPAAASAPTASSAKSLDLTLEHGEEQELSGIQSLCVTADSVAARTRIRKSLLLILDGVVQVEPEDCVARSNLMFVYDDTKETGSIAKLDRAKLTYRQLYKTSGSDLEIASALLAIVRKYRPQ